MNGRCDIDPLDVVEDLCELCGGEFCATCLLWPRGRKKAPVCRACAIKASGIRGSTKIDRRTGRRELRKRRDELHQTKDQRSAGGFKFFDEDENFVHLTDEFTGEIATNDAGPTRRRLSLGRRRHIDGPPVDQVVHDEAERSSDDVTGSQPTTYDEDPFTGSDEDADPAVHLASVGMELSEGPTPDMPLVERTLTQSDHGSATAMLEHLRSTTELGRKEASPAFTDHGTTDFATVRGPFVKPPAPHPNFENDPFAQPDLDQDPFGDAPIPIPERDPFAIISTTKPVDPLTPAVTGLRPSPDPVTPPPPVVELAAPVGLPDRSTIRPPSEPSADVDANGNWIPPILRGMAPRQEREQDLLPRRRQAAGEDQVPPK